MSQPPYERSIAERGNESQAALSASRRITQIDGLRGVAMLLVFTYHFTFLWHGAEPRDMLSQCFLRLIDADGGMGTNFFMLLSGLFGYGLLISGRWSLLEFLRRRFWRLYPLYFLLCVIYVGGSLLFPWHSRLPSDPRDALVYILQTLFLLPGVLPIRPLMDFTWTMSYIALFYFIEGGVVAVFRKYRLSRLWRFVLLACAGLLWAVIGDATGWWLPRTIMFWFGMALAELTGGIWGDRARWATASTPLAAALTIAALWVGTDFTLHPQKTQLVSPLLFGALTSGIALSAFVWFAYFGPAWWKRIFSSTPLRLLGAASYSYYLTHGFTVKVFHYAVLPSLGVAAGTTLVFWCSQVVGLLMSVATALAVYRFVEQPTTAGFIRPTPIPAAVSVPGPVAGWAQVSEPGR